MVDSRDESATDTEELRNNDKQNNEVRNTEETGETETTDDIIIYEIKYQDEELENLIQLLNDELQITLSDDTLQSINDLIQEHIEFLIDEHDAIPLENAADFEYIEIIDQLQKTNDTLDLYAQFILPVTLFVAFGWMILKEFVR